MLLLVTLLLFFLTSKAYQNQALSFHFVDEEDNIVLGKYLLNNEKLYLNLFSHHQPLTYIFSAGVQKVTQPNSLYLLIKRHREAIIVWSVIWGTFLVLRFGLPLLLTFLIYEPLKIFLLGHLFLAESLVVYPLIYLISWIFLTKNKFSKLEIPLLMFCLSLSFLLLSPIWPALLLLGFIIWRKIRKEKLGRLGWLGLSGGIILPAILAINFISISDYFYNAFYINFKYYIPVTSKEPWFLTTIKAFTSPLIAVTNFQNNNATLQIARILSIILIINLILLWKKGKSQLVLLMVLVLGLTNIRFIPPGQQEYSGFHILPWFISLILLTVISTSVYKDAKNIFLKMPLFILIIALFLVIAKQSSQSLFKKHDQNLDFYVNYSRQTDAGEAVKIMKSTEDTLFVVPDEWLIYWQADIAHASKMVNYYAWMADVPQIKNPLQEMFKKNPPAFFYCDRCQFGYFGLEEFFSKYQKIKQDGKDTSLMVLKEKSGHLTKEQIQKLSFYRFTLN